MIKITYEVVLSLLSTLAKSGKYLLTRFSETELVILADLTIFFLEEGLRLKDLK